MTTYRVYIDETADKITSGYLSDGLIVITQQRKKGEFVHSRNSF